MALQTNYGRTNAQELLLKAMAWLVDTLAKTAANIANKGIKIEHSILKYEVEARAAEAKVIANQVESMETYLAGLKQRLTDANQTHLNADMNLTAFEDYAHQRVSAIFVDVSEPKPVVTQE